MSKFIITEWHASVIQKNPPQIFVSDFIGVCCLIPLGQGHLAFQRGLLTLPSIFYVFSICIMGKSQSLKVQTILLAAIDADCGVGGKTCSYCSDKSRRSHRPDGLHNCRC